ncbi:MAG: hydrolase [Ruminococcus sp.]|nr:hydrolase [Ruminococcus sp.]
MLGQDKFIDIYNGSIKRQGSAELLEWLKKSDFFTAPASTKYHLDCKGGLVQHSINVYLRLKAQADLLFKDKYSNETLAIVFLLHDLCKVNFYKESTRNVKNEVTGQWEKLPCYTVDEKYKFGGHGSKSVYLIMLFMKLTPEEAAAINCHMGAYDRPANDYQVSGTFENNPLALMLSVADQYASFIDEREVEQ